MRKRLARFQMADDRFFCERLHAHACVGGFGGRFRRQAFRDMDHIAIIHAQIAGEMSVAAKSFPTNSSGAFKLLAKA